MELDEEQQAQKLKLDPCDILAVISDGIYEFAIDDAEQFGAEGVENVMRNNHALPLQELSQTLIDAAFEFGGDVEQADDITLVLIRRQSD
jgi:serine phosphatase RsbU (regulator of sigma subunit)